MNASTTLTPAELSHFLLNVAVVRPTFIWGPPGIGKSALVQKFADEVGLPCVSLLGSQLAPEDIIGVPSIVDGRSAFFPPRMIARDEPYCLFLDELNACSPEVMKSFYSLIHEKRVAEYRLPEGSVVIGAGNRSQDQAIVRPMPSALVNRLVHVHLRVDHRHWLEWAYSESLHPWVTDYISTRPDHLWSQPPKHEEPFSTPRSWHMLSDALKEFGEGITDAQISVLALGCLTPHHAGQFRAYVKHARTDFTISAIMKGQKDWPSAPEDRDILYFLAQSFRAQVAKELSPEKDAQSVAQKQFASKAKLLLAALASISMELAQTVVAPDEAGESLPDWFLIEVFRDLPRLAAKRG